jgi:hypothetical protein
MEISTQSIDFYKPSFVYINSEHTVIPLSTISYNKFYGYISYILSFTLNIMITTYHTTKFIVLEGIKLFIRETSTFEKSLLVLLLINIILLIYVDFLDILEKTSTIKILNILRENIQSDRRECKINEISLEEKISDIKKKLDTLYRKIKKVETIYT